MIHKQVKYLKDLLILWINYINIIYLPV